MKDQFKLDVSTEQLWKGSLFASIAHAIMVAHYPEISNEQSWDHMNYSVQDSSGTRGTVTFSEKYCFAAFRNEHSDRIKKGYKFVDINEYLRGAKPEIVKLAEAETLQYLLENVNGEIFPVITAAFWGDHDALFTNDFIEDMLINGGNILSRQMMDWKFAVNLWVDYYDMIEQQVDLLKAIYIKKSEFPKQTIRLTKSDIEKIGAFSQDGLDESRKAFDELGIKWY